MNNYSKMLIGFLGGSLLITAGCSTQPRTSSIKDISVETTNQSAPQADASAKKLGTKWGEEIDSAVQEVPATRVSTSPDAVVTVYYRGERMPNRINKLSTISVPPLQIEIENERRQTMPMYRNQQGQVILPAQEGQRYQLTIKNTDRNRTYEVVTTVDGIDVLNGRAGSYQNSGYLVRPNSVLVIDGFRKSRDQVAAFRFAAPEDSYVNQNVQGDERNIGLIGFAAFEVREELPDCEATPFPANDKYAPAPCRKK